MSCKTIFDWLKHINTKKTPVDQFTDKDWECWNSYMIHRFMSMEMGFVELANLAQRIHPDEVKMVYQFYKDTVPKNSKFLKYIKPQAKERNKDLLRHLARFFELSTREMRMYLEYLSEDEVKTILTQMGIEQKEIKKIIK